MFKRSHPHNVDTYDTFMRGASNCALCVGLARRDVANVKGVLSRKPGSSVHSTYVSVASHESHAHQKMRIFKRYHNNMVNVVGPGFKPL